MPKTRRKVNIIGHRNPDTDSICSALAYTYLKNQLGDAVYEARRAGQINRETAFVLKHFGVEPPRLCTATHVVGRITMEHDARHRDRYLVRH